MALQFQTTLRNNRLDQIIASLGASPLLRIYSGTKPANVAAAITGTLLAELAFSATAAPGAASGVLTFNAIANDTNADATGTATHFRMLTSGATAIVQGDVSTSGSDLNFNTTSIVAGGVVAVTSWTITEAGA
jgi:hypothetical protein